MGVFCKSMFIIDQLNRARNHVKYFYIYTFNYLYIFYKYSYLFCELLLYRYHYTVIPCNAKQYWLVCSFQHHQFCKFNKNKITLFGDKNWCRIYEPNVYVYKVQHEDVQNVHRCTTVTQNTLKLASSESPAYYGNRCNFTGYFLNCLKKQN